MKVQLPLLATLFLSAPGSTLAQNSYLAFEAYGDVLQIADAEVAYDQNQNHPGGSAPVMSPDHASLHAVGNRWSAYALPSAVEVHDNTVLQFTFELAAETEKGFVSVCLDADREFTGPNGRCFVLSTTQGWINGMTNVATMTPVGGTTHHSVPIGKFFTGPVNYLAFLQDSDGSDRSLGDSTISNLRLVREDSDKLEIEINGVPQELENHQMSYRNGGDQDTSDWLMQVSEDGKGMQINGNQWKALPLNSPYTITHYTVLEFDIVVTDGGDVHAICLDDDLNAATGNPCVSFYTPIDNWGYVLTTEIEENMPKRLAIPYGQIMGLKHGDHQVADYIVFVQDDDQGDKRGSMSTFSNIRIYEEDRMNLEVSIYGEDVTVTNIQDHFTASSSSGKQDSFDHVLSVSTDGRAVTANGNNWKRIRLDEPFDVTPSTMLRFSFDVPHEAEIHLICLLDAYNIERNGRNDCFATSGLDVTRNTNGWRMIHPQTKDGGSHDYEVFVGSYFTGPVQWLGFALDNDKAYTPSRAQGQSTWSNIEIYSLPSLNIGLNYPPSREREQRSQTLVIENNQKSYDQSQDTGPVRENLAVVSDDGTSITFHGNMWRALPLTEPMSAADLGDFVVSFDYVVEEQNEVSMVCFEDNLEWGDARSPGANKYDPARCILLNKFQEGRITSPYIRAYEPKVGEPHHYAYNLGKLFDRFYELKYFAFVSDNDIGDKSGGIVTISNIKITTTLTSCLKDVGFAFQLGDCTTDNFLGAIEDRMDAVNCPGEHDPLLEMMALWDVVNEMEVYKKIEHMCNSAYEPAQYDFAKAISSETQLVGEFIDGGTILNYQNDASGSSLAKDGAGISTADQYATSRLFSWPKHHALDHCDVGAAMCCWVDSRGATPLVDNTDVCYVDMKASRRTAHVKDGYSIYGDGTEGAVNCHGFAWGTDDSSIASALKGNALFKVGFMDHLYQGSLGYAEQVPGAPMCGCVDRMPVVTNAGCTKVADDTSVVDVTYNAGLAAFSATFTMGTIEYSDCGDLNSYYKSVVGEDSPDADYIDERIVGDGNCPSAINRFLAKKGLVKAY